MREIEILSIDLLVYFPFNLRKEVNLRVPICFIQPGQNERIIYIDLPTIKSKRLEETTITEQRKNRHLLKEIGSPRRNPHCRQQVRDSLSDWITKEGQCRHVHLKVDPC